MWGFFNKNMLVMFIPASVGLCEMRELQGAMRSLAISIAGIVTVLLSQIFALIY